MEVVLYTDGGSRGNPGPSAAGVHIIAEQKEYEYGMLLGDTTNNQAEYQALRYGVQQVVSLFEKVNKLEIFMDSELIVKQMRGEYKVRDPQLKIIHDEIKQLVNQIPMVQFTHVERAKNKIADALVNETLDTQHGIKRTPTSV